METLHSTARRLPYHGALFRSGAEGDFDRRSPGADASRRNQPAGFAVQHECPAVNVAANRFHARNGAPGGSGEKEIFVYATLEPSIAAYHLAFNDAGTLFVSGPTTSSNQAIHAIDRDGNTTVFYQGLGRAQGIAFDVDDNLYVAASLHGRRGIVRIDPHHQATLAVSGNNIVGLTFLDDGCAAFSVEVHRAAIEGLRPVARIVNVAHALHEIESEAAI